MATQTAISSLIGANLSSSDATALFARGTICEATDGARYEYVEASGTFTTGYMVMLSPGGTAWGYTTAFMTAGLQAGGGGDMAWTQGLINQNEFGWVAKQGRNLYVFCTGTCTGNSSVGLAVASTGRLRGQPTAEANATLFGVVITTSASTATASVAVATITWPRGVNTLLV